LPAAPGHHRGGRPDRRHGEVAIGIGNLLWAGIGDTIRVSLSAEPEEEVRVGFEILKALGLRTRGVRIVSCPSCARQGFDVIRTVEALEAAFRTSRPR
jgi:(E)-4-hydroxy-3-methylbut-2-enyl-diphosphate synthase